LAIDEYIKGRYVSQLMRLEMSLASAEAKVVTSKSDRDHNRKLQSKGYSESLKVRDIEVRLAQAELEVQGKKDEIEV
jgi:hypothetical protein